MKYHWVEAKPKYHFLLDENNKVLGFSSYSMDGYKARRLNEEVFYNGPNDFDLVMRKGRDAVNGPRGERPESIDQGKTFVEAALGIVVGDEKEKMLGDILKIFAQIKDYEIHGKIELIIRVEHVNVPPVIEQAQSVKKV